MEMKKMGKGKETNAALGSSNRPEDGNRDDQWPVQFLESSYQRCRSLSQGFPFPQLLSASHFESQPECYYARVEYPCFVERAIWGFHRSKQKWAWPKIIWADLLPACGV